MSAKERVLSGMRPSGRLQLGHLHGALHNWKELQEEYRCFYFVADWHALTSEYADTSAIRQSGFDMVLDLTFARPGLDALCRVMEKWVAHFFRIETRIHPGQSIRDQRWRWHCGLDATSSVLLNALYQGEAVDEERLRLLISLFRLEIKDKAVVIPEMAGRPVYLGLAMDETSVLRMKPQNLLVNLPLAETVGSREIRKGSDERRHLQYEPP